MKQFFLRLGQTFCLVLLAGFLATGIYIAFGLQAIRGNQALAATCQPTGYMQDNINLTAATIVTTSGNFTNITINAQPCNIGIYFAPGSSGRITNSEIYGANYYGVLNNGGRVTISQSRIHDIGETPLNGSQHGVGISFISSTGHPTSGSISGNQVSVYQKNGIVVKGSNTSSITVDRNTVTGQGPVSYIAQNGIEIGFGALANVTNNTVVGNSYTGSGEVSSGGILVFGGSCYGGPVTTRTQITGNKLTGNDVGVFLSNLDSSCQPTTTPTNISVFNNTITNNAINNTTGAQFNGNFYGYQAGISDQGDLDNMTSNHICGLGYTPVTPPPFLYVIDITNTNSPTVAKNVTSCQGTGQATGRAVTISTQNQYPKHIRAAV